MSLLKYLKEIKDIDYENFTIDNAIKLKTSAIIIKRILDKYDTVDYLSNDISFREDVEKYNQLANMAYGYLNNKMNKHIQKITNGIYI